MRSDVLPVERQQAQRQLQILVGDNYFYSGFYRKYSLHHHIGHPVNFIVPCLRNLLTAEAAEHTEFFDEIRFTRYEIRIWLGIGTGFYFSSISFLI